MPARASKLTAAACLAGLLIVAAPPAPRAEPASPNDTARFLAGLPPAPDSPLAALTAAPGWRRHARYFDAAFARQERSTIAKIRAFSATWLTNKHSTMLYMFSGPDFLYAASFFPSASTYVLSGLEPVGRVPPLTGLSRAGLDRVLWNLRGSLSSILNVSFFITHIMAHQLRAGPVYGTLPILYVFLARTGNTIHDISFVRLDQDGTLNAVPESAAGAEARRGGARGVKITFSSGDRAVQTLYYFSTDLSDYGVRRSGFLTFCGTLGAADSFIKSDSYLLHGGGFAEVRRFLLDRSATILQDDSGIPVAYFDPTAWRLQPFGRYLGPIPIFRGVYQPRLARLFRRGHAIPLDFGLGYRWRSNESNLLLARKIIPESNEAKLTPH